MFQYIIEILTDEVRESDIYTYILSKIPVARDRYSSKLLSQDWMAYYIYLDSKGQLISKGHFLIFNSTKKRTYKFQFLP